MLVSLRRIGLGSALLLPPGLMLSRSLAEALVSITALCFAADCTRRRDWAWLRRPWLLLPLLLWAWVVLCSAGGLGGRHSLVEALVALRYWLLVAGLEAWLPASPGARRWLWRMVAASALWIGLNCWLQYLAGVNVFGVPRWGDGSLTGPFDGPRAGPVFVIMLFPALLPPVLALLAHRCWAARGGGVALAAAGVATQVLIGQRMPALLALVQLVVAGLLLRRFRPALLAALAAGALLVAALPAISPPTYQKLVVHFVDQVGRFPHTEYGQIYLRAATMIAGDPALGLGFDGFRAGCGDPRWAAHPLVTVAPAAGDPATPYGCNIHPHNFWLEAGVMGGLPGLALFAAVAALWLARSGGRLRQDPLRVALFAALVGRFWPLASTTGFYNEPTAGWLFLVAGWALALRRRADAEPVRAAA